MAALEKRYPRESFTKKLERICQRLDEACERSITYRHIYSDETCQVEITSIWVVGSYARGAITCGDLDLVMGYNRIKGGLPSSRVLAKAFFGSLPLVRYYPGSPAENTSGVAFPEAIQIWSGPGCDWKASIKSITPNPNAGRAARKTDSIPLRDEQLRTYGDEYQDAADLERDGLWGWEFVEIGAPMLAPFPTEELTDDEQHLLHGATFMGRKSQQLIPALIRLMRKLEPYGSWTSVGGVQSRLRCGGTEIDLGRPGLPLRFFDHNPWVHQLVLIPHISARGPNGAWIIRRGPNHPDLQAIAGRYAYFLASSGGPNKIIYCDKSQYMAPAALELLHSREEAQVLAKLWSEGDETIETDIGRAEGVELLSLFGLVDIVEIGDHQLAMTHSGSSYLERDEATMDDIVATLPLTTKINSEA
ncbi:hypothetical protein [Pseudomonas helvetica]|uniref:hypothetical protein n=1 Tax=Pseudomonas helvetica TaxID=3136738 RepID=UPI0032657E36